MLLSLYGLVWIFRNPCHAAFGRLTLKNLFFPGYCEKLATVLFEDLHWRTFFFLRTKHRQQRHPIPFDAGAMKATASFIGEKITQDDWKLSLHVQVQIKHIFDKHFLHECPLKHEYGQCISVMYIFCRMPLSWLSLSNSVCHRKKFGTGDFSL